jgi:hypothetical protein
MSNIQLMSWKQNSDKQCYTNVEQYTKEGVYITTYKSVREAADINGLALKTISRSIKGSRKTGGGFIWKGQKNDKLTQ